MSINADVDRDGVVDTAGDSVRVGKDSASATFGALILPNIGVSGVSCPDSASTASANELESCHDAMDDIAHAPENLAPVVVAPMQLVSDKATGTLTVDGDSQGKIRVFQKTDGGWTFVRPGTTFDSTALAGGIEFGIDSRDVVRDSAVWDGTVKIGMTVDDGDTSSSDSVTMVVAPIVLHNHTEKVSTLYTSQSGDRPEHQRFASDLAAALGNTKVDNELKIIGTEDNWAQDYVEFGYVSMPAADGQVRSIEIAVRSPQPTRIGGRALFDLRGPNFGAVQTGGDGYRQVDSFGNLEVIPPYEHNGRSYPAGRIIYGNGGAQSNMHEDVRTFFTSQQLQSPMVELDTSWLAIAHVDEFVQFLPADNARGWTIAVADPRSGLELMKKAQRDGHGSEPAGSNAAKAGTSIDDLLADQSFLDANSEAAAAIDANLEILMNETGVGRDEVVAVPGLYEKSGWTSALVTNDASTDGSSDGKNAPEYTKPFDVNTATDGEVTYAPGTMGAFLPGAINGIVVDSGTYFAPKQWGPVIDGTDIFDAAVREVYAAHGMTVTLIDDYESHHAIGGEIHCGTNAVRAVRGNWWKL
ncbi:hypothetical protein HQO26_13680 [Rhodococcus fascians]|nr:hypothetical protein [Rhodococcus fascians]MBY4417278.1 hypothetical protein [Rhodococcus fascians]